MARQLRISRRTKTHRREHIDGEALGLDFFFKLYLHLLYHIITLFNYYLCYYILITFINLNMKD